MKWFDVLNKSIEALYRKGIHIQKQFVSAFVFNSALVAYWEQ